MNILLIDETEVLNNEVVLHDRRASHIIKVLKSQPGDTLKVGVINGPRGFARVEELRSKRPHEVKISLHLGTSCPPVPEIDLILALPRPIMLRRILSQVTALGVGRIFLINANRVEKSFWEATLLEEENMREHILTGLEQCGDTRLVPVDLYRGFKPFVEENLPEICKSYDRFLVADPSGKQSIKQAASGITGRCLLAIGPEGGWVDFELEKFAAQGAIISSLGDRILKVDTAVVALHAQISAIADFPEYRFEHEEVADV